MPDDPYTIADLARLAGVTPRTVRYYVAQGLLPSPEAAGPGTRYSAGHLARLRLIRQLQREHLPLAEIRNRLASLGDEEVRGLVGEGGETRVPAAPAQTLAYVQDLMARTGVQSRVSAAHEAAAPYQARYEPLVPDAFPTRAAPGDSVTQTPASTPWTPEPRPLPPDRSTWERHTLNPDVELHIRRPLDRRTNKRVDQLIRIARELFDDEG
jgi:DNA-binding transcriptional MerR regulator